jgi:type VII secretion protein EccB
MQSRRDQVQAQSYVLGRLTSALVMAEPETQENPHRRILTATIAGTLITALVVAGFAVYGFIRPGGATSWREPGTLVVEKETGGRFVFVGGALLPVLNYTSAVLLFGKRPKVTAVSSASLRSVPRGGAVGIVGAPDTLPNPAGLRNAAWTVCALAERDQAGTLFTGTGLIIGSSPATAVLDVEHGLAARATTGETFLIWRGTRFALTRQWLARAFGYDVASPVAVEPGWLDQLPVGSDVGPIDVPGRGEPGPVVDGRPTRIGQIFVASVVGGGAAQRFYLLQRDGLSQLSATGAAVMSSDPETAAAYGSNPVEPIELTPASLAAMPISRQPTFSSDLPEAPPLAADAAGPDRAWCVRWVTGAADVQVTAEPAPASTVAGHGVGTTRTEQNADVISVGPGVGGLARLGRPDQENGTSYFLVTDAGIKYPLASASVAEVLGYPPAGAATVPAELLALLPTGPLLQSDQARR